MPGVHAPGRQAHHGVSWHLFRPKPVPPSQRIRPESADGVEMMSVGFVLTRLSVTADRGRPLVLGDPRGSIACEFARIGVIVRRWIQT